LHFRRGHACLALLLWAAHLLVAVWHGSSADHRSCAPDGDPIASLAAAHATCAADDFFTGAAPLLDPPALADSPAADALPPAAPVAAPDRTLDVLAFAPKASPPAAR
jgi:hypothetical protein